MENETSLPGIAVENRDAAMTIANITNKIAIVNSEEKASFRFT
jgi:hypothetical protein